LARRRPYNLVMNLVPAFSSPQGATLATPAAAVDIVRPSVPLVPVVFASPHSGLQYPVDFVAASALELATLRKSEDCYVDALFAYAPALGAPLLRALYPRAYLDVNREAYELDPEMFADPLPAFVNTTSARVAAGLGTIARIVASRREIYRDKLTFSDAQQRIDGVYKPYHHALRDLVSAAWNRFGFCVLVDCHSMPSTGLPNMADGTRGIDIVLGDRGSMSCAPVLTDTIEASLANLGYRVTRNNPYAGGFTTQHYGDPTNGVHVIQIEINRAIYMDEVTLQARGAFARLRTDLQIMTGELIAMTQRHAQSLTHLRLSAE